MVETPLTGRCLCGRIRYRVAGAPLWVAHCHCASCRRATGAPLTTYAGFSAEHFAYTAGEPARFASSEGVSRSYCGGCGTPLTYEGARWPGEVHVLVGTMDRPEAVTPTGEAFVEERLPWLHLATSAQPAIPRTLETERLLLRPFRESDLDVLARLNVDPRFMRYIGPVVTRDDSWRQLAMLVGHWELRGYGPWAAEHQGQLIGRIGLWRPEGWPDLEVGWAIDPDFWGQGLATEGARAALDQAALALGRHDPVSVIRPDNAASIRVAEKLGARYERTMILRGAEAQIYRHRHPC